MLLDKVDPAPLPLIIDITITEATDAGCTDAQVSRALSGYAAERIARVETEKARIRRLGLKELTFGLCFLALCLASASTLAAFEIGPGWFRDVIVEGLVIVGWIALWHPVDMLFFERLPLIRKQRVLNRVRRAEVTLRWNRSSVESVDD
ncbi:hypothetical protein ACL9RL_18750 [Plantibacter sp. Mn2098]|uniref:hypothetical protein n=1 Tax=Plantibacter sp. Mn2098 TaxID=3395266 RepID=UPI003BECB2C6